VLLAAGDFGNEAVVREIELKAQTDAVDEVAARFGQLLQAAGDRREGIGLELAKCQCLHLGHHLVHADPLGERRVNIHRLAGDAAALLFRRNVVERAHIVQPVGELHEQDADVVRQGQQELS